MFTNIFCNLFSEHNNVKCNIDDVGGDITEKFKKNSLDIFCGWKGIKECDNVKLAGATKVWKKE